MSTNSKSDSETVFDVEELLQIGTRCKELWKEKDMLRESQSQSFDLIKRLELHVKSLSETHNEDKKHIQKLERELMNCTQEIDYLQDQLNARNEEVCSLSEHVRSLELKVVDMETLQDMVAQLEDELKNSQSECLFFSEELQKKEESALRIEKLEESLSSSVFESQCEIESLKLDIVALERTCIEAEEVIQCLENENKELKKKLLTSEMNARVFCQKLEEWMEKEDKKELNTHSYVSELERNHTISKEMGKVFGALLSKLALALATDADLEEKRKGMSLQICQYELLVKQLKEELREEKLKAKEEAEDLAQEMAELRYQMTNMLEEECKRRAYIEQASLQRIADLEAQIILFQYHSVCY